MKESLPSSGESRARTILRGFANPSQALGRDLLRWCVVACQLATLYVTWPLWQRHASPPELPADWYTGPSFAMGPLLVASLALALIYPRGGILLHGVLLVVAMAMDQTRIQPQVVSSCLLLMATLPWKGWDLIGRAHLVALWFYSGFHKLLSKHFYEYNPSGVIEHTLGLVFRSEGAENAPQLLAFKISVAVAELLLALMALIPKTRRIACVIALFMHGGILASLVAKDWNSSVWSWNIAVVAGGFALLWNWSESPLRAAVKVSTPVQLAVLVILLWPAGYYLGITDAHLAHCLYSDNKPIGYIIQSRPGSPNRVTRIGTEHFEKLNVPIPKEHRLLKAHFRRSANTAPGDALCIIDPRRGAHWRDVHERWYRLTTERRARPISKPSAKTSFSKQ